MSTVKKIFFVDAKRVIGMQCNGQTKKDKIINSGPQKTVQKTENWAARIPLKTRLESLVLHCIAVPGFVRWSASLIHMQYDVNIRLYEYWHEQVKIRKKRWNNKEIKKFYWK